MNSGTSDRLDQAAAQANDAHTSSLRWWQAVPRSALMLNAPRSLARLIRLHELDLNRNVAIQPQLSWKDLSQPTKKVASRPVSRVLYGLGALRRRDVAAIHLGRVLPRASCNLPGRRAGNCPEGCPSCRPYSVLLPVWFAMPPLLPGTRWALTPPFHPCRAVTRRRRRAVCFLWHFPWGRPRRMLSGTVFPWSPDFPHPQPFGSRWCGRPAGWQAR